MMSRQKRGCSLGTIFALFVAIALLIVGAGLIAKDRAERANAPVDLEGNAIQLAPEDTPAPETIAEMEVEPGTPESDRLVVPSVDLDVPIGTLSAVDGVITPPGFTEAYYVRNMGVSASDASDGTLYLVTHSVKDGYAPGNALIDVDAGTARVTSGDSLAVGGLTYVIDETVNVDKDELATHEALWTNDPGRLVLITCLQRSEGRSLQNVVIIASLQE